MKLLTKDIHERLAKNGRVREQLAEASSMQQKRAEPDFIPVVKLFTPDGNCTWLLTELDPQEPDIAFGLCDLGMGSPELGSVRISELESVRGPMGLAIERDRYFTPDKTISAYAAEARASGQIKA